MSTLDEIQQRSLKTLHDAVNGHIDIHTRQAMWSALDPTSKESDLQAGMAPTAGHIARATLMNECLRRALPAWYADERRADEDLLDARDSPPAIVASVDAWLSGAMSHVDLEAIAERYQDLSFYLFELHDVFPNTELIGHACRGTLWVASWDQESDYEDEYREEENEVFPCDFMVAWLESRGAPWDTQSRGEQSMKRRAFWEWYISSLYPRCWRLAHHGGTG